MRKITLGSLFDGVAGFPLAGSRNGITPKWASEIEPFPIAVTKARFPDMKHVGSVKEINGRDLEPVDIITFGSPCQDLSVAGKQAGIHEGERSSLFFEAIRIIKEMREHDKHTGRADEFLRPRFAVWENVPGAFSSNKGRDFQAVLQSFCEIRGVRNHIVPMPPTGRWKPAGSIVGNGWSVSWRTLDAQFWGVPQRRKRIFLVADFAGERAGEVLFNEDRLHGDSSESKETRKGTAAHAERSAGRSGGVRCLNQWDCESKRQYAIDGVYRTLDAGNGAGGQAHGVVIPNLPKFDGGGVQRTEASGFDGSCGGQTRSIGYETGVAPTVLAGKSMDVVYAIDGNVIDRDAKQNGMGISEDVSPTLNTQDKNAVCYKQDGFADYRVYDARGNGDGETIPTLTGDHENRITDYTALCVERKQDE